MVKPTPKELDINSFDALLSTLKGFASGIPFVGPLIAVAIEYGIPNQRNDRIVKFALQLEKQIQDVKEQIKEKINTPEGIDLLVDALYQSTKAFTEDRRIYISNMLKNGLTKEEQTHDQNKKLFKILDELNDSEIILLKYYSMSLGRNWDHPFLKKHWEVLGPIENKLAGQKTEPRSVVFIENYINTLDRLGLVIMQTKYLSNPMPIGVTPLGNLLLEYIEVPDEE